MREETQWWPFDELGAASAQHWYNPAVRNSWNQHHRQVRISPDVVRVDSYPVGNASLLRRKNAVEVEWLNAHVYDEMLYDPDTNDSEYAVLCSRGGDHLVLVINRVDRHG